MVAFGWGEAVGPVRTALYVLIMDKDGVARCRTLRNWHPDLNGSTFAS